MQEEQSEGMRENEAVQRRGWVGPSCTRRSARGFEDCGVAILLIPVFLCALRAFVVKVLLPRHDELDVVALQGGAHGGEEVGDGDVVL